MAILLCFVLLTFVLVSMSALAGMSVNPVNGLSSLQSTIQSMSMQSMANPMHSLALPTSSPPYISQVGSLLGSHMKVTCMVIYITKRKSIIILMHLIGQVSIYVNAGCPSLSIKISMFSIVHVLCVMFMFKFMYVSYSHVSTKINVFFKQFNLEPFYSGISTKGF